MAWTTPPTFVADTELAADDLNLLSDDLNYLKSRTDAATLSGVAVNRNGVAQSISDSSWTAVSWTTEIFDEGGWIAVTSSTITVPAGAIPAGYTNVLLDIRFIVTFAANSTGKRKARVTKNGSSVFSDSDAADSDTTDLGQAWPISAAAGDTFQLEVWQNSGGALNASAVALSIVMDKPVS